MSSLSCTPNVRAPGVTTDQLRATGPRVLVAAHRGVWTRAPENSLAAIEDAIDQHADIIELDVRATADDVLVLLHDATLDRMSNVTGLLRERNYRDLSSLRLRQRAGASEPLVADAHLPTLSSALESCRDRIIVNVDAKEPSLLKHIVRFVMHAGMAHQVFVKANVDGPEDIEALQRSEVLGRLPFVPMMRARRGRFAEDLRALRPLQCPLYEVAFDAVSDLEEGRAELQSQGSRLWVNTVAASHSLDFNDARALRDPDAVWGRLLDAGVNVIQTDEVADLVNYLQSRGRR